MTEDQARITANVLIGAAAIGAAIYVLRTPRLRRLAWRLAKGWAAGPAAAWTVATVHDAWADSARRVS